MKNVTIRTRVAGHNMLKDRRLGRFGIVFGTLSGVAKQYGIDVKEENGWLILSAPQKRMQMMVERLHFAGVPYEEIS